MNFEKFLHFDHKSALTNLNTLGERQRNRHKRATQVLVGNHAQKDVKTSLKKKSKSILIAPIESRNFRRNLLSSITQNNTKPVDKDRKGSLTGQTCSKALKSYQNLETTQDEEIERLADMIVDFFSQSVSSCLIKYLSL